MFNYRPITFFKTRLNFLRAPDQGNDKTVLEIDFSLTGQDSLMLSTYCVSEIANVSNEGNNGNGAKQQNN